jgi:2'-hydroxyisoflavone reductase
MMNILVLGGTRFIGRHIVERLSLGGHRIVCFHRGESACELPIGVEQRYGDRNESLSAVAAEHWDAIVDTSGYRPEQLEPSLELNADRYLFISTANVYRDLTVPGVSEASPTFESFDPSDEAAAYGGYKAACERMVMERYPTQSIIFRPGLVAGRWDYTGRVTYWCRRFLRGGTVLAPDSPSRRIQLIDAGDIAAFAAHALSNKATGVFNTVGPAGPVTMADFLRQCELVAAERGAPRATIVWVDGAFLLSHGVQEWTEMPLWLTDKQFAGILEMKNTKALAAGLELRPFADTARSVLDSAEETPLRSSVGLAPEREVTLLDEYAKR